MSGVGESFNVDIIRDGVENLQQENSCNIIVTASQDFACTDNSVATSSK